MFSTKILNSFAVLTLIMALSGCGGGSLSNSTDEIVEDNASSELIEEILDENTTTQTIENNVSSELVEEIVDDFVFYQGVKLYASKSLGNSDFKLDPITDEDFNNLKYENKLLVANKLHTALFSGVPKQTLDAQISSSTFISDLFAKLQEANSDATSVEETIAQKEYNYYNEEREKILARLFHMKLGKHYVNRWSAYVLTQSIMFSPAFELDTVGSADITNVYNDLVINMDNDYTMEMITYLHMTSDNNWKRFRSPEDNGREMLEIFLHDFNDSHVPKAAITLKNWRLDRDDKELIVGLNKNTDPQELFDINVTTGIDFYRELVNYKKFKEGVVKRLVELYFGAYEESQKEQIIQNILSSKAERFQDVLLQIIFSKEFLFHVQRVKTFEEATYSIAKRINFYDYIRFFQDFRDAIDKSNQSSMKYKLGRSVTAPIDTLSFSNFYGFMHKRILLDYRSNTMSEWDSGWDVSFIDKSIPNTSTPSSFIEYLFLTLLSRYPTQEELNMLLDYSLEKGYENVTIINNRQNIALIVLEYISRLTELYAYKTIEG